MRVRSSIAHLDGRARISRRVPEGIVGVHFHFKNFLLNRLIPTQFDPESFTPNYKAVLVNIERLA